MPYFHANNMVVVSAFKWISDSFFPVVLNALQCSHRQIQGDKALETQPDFRLGEGKTRQEDCSHQVTRMEVCSGYMAEDSLPPKSFSSNRTQALYLNSP